MDFDLSVEDFRRKLASEAQLVDVRTDWEYEQGHIEHAVLVPVQELSLEALEKAGVTKEKDVLLYCRSGGRSAHAGHIMAALGYRVWHLDGGIEAWIADGFPVVRE